MAKTLSFFDVKTRKKFTSGNYTTETKIIRGKNGRRKMTFAVIKKDGRKIYRIVKNEKA